MYKSKGNKKNNANNVEAGDLKSALNKIDKINAKGVGAGLVPAQKRNYPNSTNNNNNNSINTSRGNDKCINRR